MKRKSLILISLLFLTSCGNQLSSFDSQSVPTVSHLVTFYLNSSSDDQKVFSTQVINDGQKLLDPGTPTLKEKVFSGWFTDRETTITYTLGFNIEISSSFSLYAKWTPYEDLSEKEKVSCLLDTLRSISGTVSSCSSVIEGKETYAVAPNNPIEYYVKKDSQRYQDLTQSDYYNESKEQVATSQYFYDKQHFYNIYNDIGGKGTNSYKVTSNYQETKKENFLNIGFENQFGYLLRYYRDVVLGNDYQKKYVATLSANPTEIDVKTLDHYSFSFDLQEEFESDQVGTVDLVYQLTFGLVFLNGFISRSIYTYNYAMAIQGESQDVITETTTTSYQIGYPYSEFTGVRFNPDDYTEKKN